jgi:hypothetical protein
LKLRARASISASEQTDTACADFTTTGDRYELGRDKTQLEAVQGQIEGALGIVGPDAWAPIGAADSHPAAEISSSGLSFRNRLEHAAPRA